MEMAMKIQRMKYELYYESLPSETPETPKIQWPPVFYVALLNNLRLLRDRANRRARYQFNKDLRGK